MKIVIISDTHSRHHDIRVPDGDVLVHAGDATFNGTQAEIASFGYWFGNLPHKHKIFIAGNHDWLFQTMRPLALGALRSFDEKIHYLEDSGVEIDGIKFWGSPWQPEFFNWAFNLPRGKQLERHWDMIPENTDVLITHSPPCGILDWSIRDRQHTGCRDMLAAVLRVRPQVHAFGHIHGSYGTKELHGTKFVNACICTEKYMPTNKPITAKVNEVISL